MANGSEESFAKVYGKARFYVNEGAIAGITLATGIAGFMNIEPIALISAAICFVNIEAIALISAARCFVNIEAIALISAAICFVNVIFVLQLREQNFYSQRKRQRPR